METTSATNVETKVTFDDPGSILFTPATGKVDGRAMALLALSHTVIEHRIYMAMRSALEEEGKDVGSFGIRFLVAITGLSSYSSVRRACAGLVEKLSVEETAISGYSAKKSLYRVYSPEEIFRRRVASGMEPYPVELQQLAGSGIAALLLADIAGRGGISRREALVALYCAEGLTNSEIGERLSISGRTVKYHLRQLFGKLKIKRRSEVVARLLASTPETNGRIALKSREEGEDQPASIHV